MGINDFNKTPEVSTSVESKNSRSLPFKKKLTTLALGIALTTGLSHAQNTTPDTNKVLAQTEIAADTIPSVDTILAKYNIDLATIDTNNDRENLVKARDELRKICEDMMKLKVDQETLKPYLTARSDIKNRVKKIDIDIKGNTAIANADAKLQEATKKEEESRKRAEEAERVLGGNK